MDSAKVGSVINRTLADAILDRAFPGRPHLAYFAFDTDPVKSPGEVFEDAGKAKTAGYLIDQADLEERTGYRLVKDETAAPQLPGMFGNRNLANKATVPEQPSEARQPKAAPSPRGDATSHPSQPSRSSQDVLAAFAKDTGPAAKAIQELLKNPSKEAAKALLGKLDSLLPEDPEMAAVIAEAMAAEFGDDGRAGAPRRPLANEVQRVPSGNGNGGQFTGSTNQPDGNASRNESASDDVKTFLSELPKRIDPERADRLLSEGFFDTDADGNDVHYGQLLLDHINRDSHSEEDKNARKKRLGEAISMIRQSRPMKSGTTGKDKERVYFGLVEGKAYIAVADEHDEINAMEMVSYRRDGRKDER